MLTIDNIRTAFESKVDGYFLTETSRPDPGLHAPGVVIYWDDANPDETGWAYRLAQSLDPETMTWHGEESGVLDDEQTLSELVTIAADYAKTL